jgi:hypothetical protein
MATIKTQKPGEIQGFLALQMRVSLSKIIN